MAKHQHMRVSQMPLRRWPPKTILKTGFYVSAGLVTVIYTFLTFQANFIRLEIDTAIIEPILAFD